jgi:hypothetical protein
MIDLQEVRLVGVIRVVFETEFPSGVEVMNARSASQNDGGVATLATM